MTNIMPITPQLPAEPISQEQLLPWATDFSKAIYALYTTLARRLENSVQESIEALRPGLQGTRRIYIPSDLDQVDFERTAGWFSVAGLTTFNSHANSAIDIVGTKLFTPAANISTASTTYVAIDTVNFTLTLTLDANKVVIAVLYGGTVQGSGVALVGNIDLAVDNDILGGSGTGIIQASSTVAASPFQAGVSFKGYTALTAAAHVFKPVMRTTAGTFTVLGGVDQATTLALLVLELKHGTT